MLSLWNPFLSLKSINFDNEISKRDLFDRFFQYNWNDIFSDFTRNYSTGIEYVKVGEDLVITVELPGVNDSNLNVNMKDSSIYIKAEIKSKTSSSIIEKKFLIPHGYDKDNINAELKNGILTLTFKSLIEKENQYKKIDVKIA